MKRFVSFGLLMILAPMTRAEAANLAVITNPPTMINALIFVGAVICAGGAFKVFSLVRGGRMSRCWQMFFGGFALLAAAEIIMVLQALEIVFLPEVVVPGLLALMAGLFLFGILDVKRTLS